MPVRRRAFRTSRPARRSREWARQVGSFTNTGSNQQDATSLTAEYRAMGGDIHGATVMGIRLQYFLGITNTTARLGNGASLYIGIWSGDAETAAEVPTPLTGAGADPRHAKWAYLERIWVPQIAAASAGARNVTTTSETQSPPWIEIKSRRKLDELDTDLWLTMETNTPNPADVFNFDFMTSTMLFLP